MKKILIISALVVVVLATLGIAGFAYAQSGDPDPYPFGPGMMSGGGRGMMSGDRGAQGGRGGMMNGVDGPIHTYMVAALAEAFDMTPEDLEARLDAGDTCWTISQEKGLTEDEFLTLMKDARTTALKQAVEAGAITQEQADWMSQRMAQMQDYGGGFGSCQGMGGRGAGRGGRWNSTPQQP